MVSAEQFKKIAELNGCTVEDLKKDPHTVADGMVEIGAMTEEEASSEYGFAQIREACGLEGGW